ncbi:hypothetical protein P154DRAFT_525448 [Amniculicola lignicola CBS 123094]|uniref:Methyltransferase n=1 Tax=Amniculicola lignicola CBS 123094 TaxID=1392246 RepID=A0A6A5W699_9PLEO|nr:hypothetical protein P154DRAFT_525448 [Amniculicola lignicola CBS 123094]
MSTATDIPRGPTIADLVFITPSEDGLALRVEDRFISESAMKEVHSVPITDIRGNEDSFSLEVHAFEALRNIESSIPDEVFADDDAIKNVYYSEVSKLLQQHLGVQEVVIQGHGVRRQGKDGQRQPIAFVHADHSDDVARRMAQEHESQTKKNHLHEERFRIFSVWRPLNGTVESMPLAFVAGDSLDKNDLFPVQYSDPQNEFTGLRFNPGQRWYYWSGMNNTNRLLLQCTDSRMGLHVAGRTPHSAFAHVGSSRGAKPRESIEVRALVFG